MSTLENITHVGAGSPMKINWELVSHCQYNCTYCYYKPYKSETDYLSLSKIILKKLETVKDNISMTLLGGEPSLHPSFVSVVQDLFKLPTVQSIAIVTNLAKPLPLWLELIPFKEKVKLAISVHIEYPQKDLIEKLQGLMEHFTLDIVFNVHNDLAHLPKMEELAKSLVALSNEKNVTLSFMRLHGIDRDCDDYLPYPKEIEDFMARQNELLLQSKHFETVNIKKNNKWEVIPKFELVENKMNAFKGWSCDLKAFIIHENGIVSQPCRNEKKHILLTEFKSKALTCPFRFCVCDDYWEFPKTKKEQAL